MDLSTLRQAAQRHIAGFAQSDDLPSSLPESFTPKGFEPTDLASIVESLIGRTEEEIGDLVSKIKAQI